VNTTIETKIEPIEFGYPYDSRGLLPFKNESDTIILFQETLKTIKKQIKNRSCRKEMTKILFTLTKEERETGDINCDVFRALRKKWWYEVIQKNDELKKIFGEQKRPTWKQVENSYKNSYKGNSLIRKIVLKIKLYLSKP